MKNPRTCSNTRTTLYTGCPGEALLSLLKQALRLGREEREGLLFAGEKLTAYLQREETSLPGTPERKLVSRAAAQYAQSYAPKWGGFGQAPKFTTPHNLIFLMRHARLRAAVRQWKWLKIYWSQCIAAGYLTTWAEVFAATPQTGAGWYPTSLPTLRGASIWFFKSAGMQFIYRTEAAVRIRF